MATIATLNVQLTASIGRFTKGMKAAARPVQRLGGVIQRITKGVTLFRVAMASAAVAGLTLLVKKSFESIDALAKTSDKLGIATEKLAAYRHQAELTGVAANNFDLALQRMVRRIAEAGQGAGEAVAALKELGLDAQKLASLPVDEQLAQIADAMQGVEGQSNKVRLAFKLFDSEGVGLVNTLADGREGLEAAEGAARKLGIAFSRTDAAKIEAANNAMARLRTLLQGAVGQLAIKIAPIVEAIANKVTEMGTDGQSAGKLIVNAFKFVVKAIGVMADWLNFARGAFHAFQGVATGALLVIIKTINNTGRALAALADAIPGVEAEFDNFLTTFEDELERSSADAFRKSGQAFRQFFNEDASRRVTRFFDDLERKADAAARKIAQGKTNTGGTADEAKRLAEQMEKAAAAAKAVDKSIDGLRKQVRQFNFSDFQKQFDDLRAGGATPDQLEVAERLLIQLNTLDAEKQIAGLRREIDMLGATDIDKAVAAFAETATSQEQILRFKALQERLADLRTEQERWQALTDRAASVIDSVTTPMERYEQTIGDLNELLNAGLLTWDQYGRAVRNARNELEQTNDAGPGSGPQLVRAGTAAAQRLAFDAGASQRRLRDDLPKKHLATAERSETELTKIEKNTRGFASFQVIENF